MTRISGKKARREDAIKREKRKKTIIVAVCMIVVIGIIAFVAADIFKKSKERVFTDGHQTVTLRVDGTFNARLAHETRTGTYTEKTEGSITIISFVSGGVSANGSIDGNTLTLPDEWDDHHGHGTILKLK